MAKFSKKDAAEILLYSKGIHAICNKYGESEPFDEIDENFCLASKIRENMKEILPEGCDESYDQAFESGITNQKRDFNWEKVFGIIWDVGADASIDEIRKAYLEKYGVPLNRNTARARRSDFRKGIKALNVKVSWYGKKEHEISDYSGYGFVGILLASFLVTVAAIYFVWK